MTVEPEIVQRGRERFAREGERGLAWVWMQSTPDDRAGLDAWIVAVGHPLGFEPGTAEDRFRTLCRGVRGFGNTSR